MSNDTSFASVGLKACCACGTEVAGQPRMKDSQGRYWCVPCGEADQRKKQMAATEAPCAGCRQMFSKGKLDRAGDHFYCKACLKKRTKVAARPAAAASVPSSSGTIPMGAGIAAMTNVVSGRGGAAAMTADQPDRKRLMIMSAIFAVLIVMLVLFNFVWA